MSNTLPAPSAALQQGIDLLRSGLAADALPVLLAEAERARSTGESDAEAWAISPLVQALLSLGERGQAAAHAARGLALTQAAGDTSGTGHFRQLRALALGEADPEHFDATESLAQAEAHLHRGQLEPAVALLSTILDGARMARARGSEASAAGLLAQALAGSDRSDEALSFGLRALDLARELGDDASARHFLAIIGSLGCSGPPDQTLSGASQLLRDGRPDVATALLSPLVEEAARAGREELESEACGLLAQAQAHNGDRLNALVTAQHALEIAERRGQPQVAAHFRRLHERLTLPS